MPESAAPEVALAVVEAPVKFFPWGLGEPVDSSISVQVHFFQRSYWLLLTPTLAGKCLKTGQEALFP
jgi:hypothetical protein